MEINCSWAIRDGAKCLFYIQLHHIIICFQTFILSQFKIIYKKCFKCHLIFKTMILFCVYKIIYLSLIIKNETYAGTQETVETKIWSNSRKYRLCVHAHVCMYIGQEDWDKTKNILKIYLEISIFVFSWAECFEKISVKLGNFEIRAPDKNPYFESSRYHHEEGLNRREHMLIFCSLISFFSNSFIKDYIT